MKNNTVVDFLYISSKINSLGEVYVFWDVHSKDRIFIRDYWKFGKKEILCMNFDVLMNNLDYLPDDIYIFDHSFEWTMVLTHEEIENKRWCLKSGDI